MKLPLSCLLLTLGGQALAAPSTAAPGAVAPSTAAPAIADTRTPSEPEVARPVRVALLSTSAFGVTHARFFNQLLGARLEYRFGPRFSFGGALAYANLKGKEGRVHNVLPELMVGYRIPLKGESFGVPIRYGLGFLPKNGPTLRLGVGVDFSLSESLSLELTPLETLVWVNRERPEISLDGCLALSAAF